MKIRNVEIPQEWYEKNRKLVESEEELLELWQFDREDYELDEVNEMAEKAKKNKLLPRGQAGNDSEKPKKPRTIKISDEKITLFSNIYDSLCQIYGENVTILRENKLIEVKNGGKTFKIDLIEQRKPKS